MTKLSSIPMFALLVTLLSCGGGSGSGSGVGSQPNPVNVQGKWEVIALSTLNPTAPYPDTLIEANLSQTGSSVSAGAQSVALVPFYHNGGANWGIANPTVNVCGGTGETIDATITAGTSLTFTLTESGPDGTYTVSGTAMISADGKTMIGTYTSAAACALPADAGSLTGALVPSFSGTYTATFSDGSTAALTVTEDANYNLTINATEQGQAFTLSGEAVGGGFSVSGTVPGAGEVTYEGVYLTSELVPLIMNINNVLTQTGDCVTLSSDGLIGVVVPN